MAQCKVLGLFTHLLYVCKLLHMNELEITAWALNLESADIVWNSSDFDQPIIFLITGFQAKVE